MQDGSKVTVWYQITPRDTPTTSYSDIQQFTQGQHTIPLGIEQRIAGMYPGEARAFALSPEEGFGPYDTTKVQSIPPTELPIEAREGDTIANRAGIPARIIRILPEKAMLDLNHPLAGKQLLISLQIVTVENSNEEKTLP